MFFLAPIGAILLALPLAYLAAFAAALADATIIVAVRDSAAGRTVSLSDAWGVAWDHRRPLAAWAFDLLVVGLAIRIAAALFGRLGQILGWAAEIAWALVALLVVPAIVVGEVGMPDAFEVSRRALRQTFGDRIRGVANLGVLGGVIAVIGAASILLAALTDSGALIVASWVAICVLALAYAFVVDAAMAVLGYAIYAHATQHPLPPGFTAQVVQGAFVTVGDPAS